VTGVQTCALPISSVLRFIDDVVLAKFLGGGVLVINIY
jgi:hypothetical protein